MEYKNFRVPASSVTGLRQELRSEGGVNFLLWQRSKSTPSDFVKIFTNSLLPPPAPLRTIQEPVHYPAAIAISLTIAFAFTACGQRFSNANIDVINQERDKDEKQANKGGLSARDAGVSPKLVESILGPPKSVETRKISLETQKKEVDVVRYIYEQDGQTLELHFFDGKLISPIPHLGEKPAESESKP